MSAGLTDLNGRFSSERNGAATLGVDKTFVLSQRDIAIKMTRRGYGLLITVMLLFLLAINFNNNQVYLMTFLLASLFCVVLLQTYRMLAGLVVQAAPVPPVFAGETAALTLTVVNSSVEPRPGLSAALTEAVAFGLDAQGQQSLVLNFPVWQRGWQNLEVVILSSAYPLGVFEARARLRCDDKVLVYPTPSTAETVLLFRQSLQSAGGEHYEPGGQDDFDGIRAYQAGDPLRRIHWQSYAKGHGLLSKQFTSESGGDTLYLTWETTPGADTEARLSLLCRWVLDAEAAGCLYGLELPGCYMTPANGRAHCAACLKALALA